MAEKKKAYRKVVRKDDGKVRVAFIDAATGQEIFNLEGYELIDSGGFEGMPVFPGGSGGDDLEQSSNYGGGGGAGYTPAEPFNWDEFQNRPGASRGTGDIIADLTSAWIEGQAAITDAKQTAVNAGMDLLGIPTTTTPVGRGTWKEEVEQFTGVPMAPGQGVDGKGTPAKKTAPLATPNTPTPPLDIPDKGAFQPLKIARGNTQGVDPRTLDILNEAAMRSPYIVQVVSGKDSRARGGQHPKGHALDIELVDPDTGKVLPNYQHGPTFRVYEQFAQTTKVVQTNKYPELDQNWVWGGYFWNNGPGNYGNMDLMHFDIGGRAAAGTWQTGLTPQAKQAYAQAYPGFTESEGMGNPKKYALTEPGTPIPGIGFETSRSAALATPEDATPAASPDSNKLKLQEAIDFLPVAAKEILSARLPINRIANALGNLPAENIGAAVRAYDDVTGVLSPMERGAVNLPFGAGDNIAKGKVNEFFDNNQFHDPYLIGDGSAGVGNIAGAAMDLLGRPIAAAGGVVDDLTRAFPQAAAAPTMTALATAKQTPKMLKDNMQDTSAALGPYSLNDPERRRVIAQTILGEAAGEGVDGMAAVAHVIKNRALSGAYPTDPKEVALQEGQFSTWNGLTRGGNNPDKTYPVGSKEFNVAANIADMVFNDLIPDNTGGALHYHTTGVEPPWSSPLLQQTGQPTFKLGNHVFYPEKPVDPVLNSTAAMATPNRNLAARDSSAGQTTLNKPFAPTSVASYSNRAAAPTNPTTFMSPGTSPATNKGSGSGTTHSPGQPFSPSRTTTDLGSMPSSKELSNFRNDSGSDGSYQPATSFMSGPTSSKPNPTTFMSPGTSPATTKKSSSSSGGGGGGYTPAQAHTNPSRSSNTNSTTFMSSGTTPKAATSSSSSSNKGKSASGSQKVTTSSGSTVTKSQRDAFGGY